MPRKKDILLIAAVLAGALILLLISRLMPKKTVEERTADVTLAPDAIEYVDATAAPPASSQPAAETAVPEMTAAPATDSAATAVPDVTYEEKPPVTAEQATTAAPEVTAEPAATAAPEVTAEPTATAAPETKGDLEVSAAPADTADAGTSGTTETKRVAGPMIGPMPEISDEPVKGHVVIMVGGRQYGDPIPMDRDKIITIRQSDEKINRVHITRDSVYMESSTCENQDCVGEGEVTLENYKTRILSTFIVCLPNAVTVEMIPADPAEAQQ
ncbi:MAG: NusG domain II-containing protein [Clostridia bacterium]|nr:NusG domain II-containing protein [Clostridia bacterium]